MCSLEVKIPDGEHCQYENYKPCLMASYTKKWNAYNCKLYNRILKGEKHPRKCRQCIEYCNAQIAKAEVSDDG